MIQHSSVGGHDAPIESVNEDLLNGVGVARAIHRVLTTTPSNWSTRVGLYGAWGSGKTSILNLLRTLEEADGAMVLSFSAWFAAGESGVISQFYATLEERLRRESFRLPIKQRAKSVMAKLGRFGGVAGFFKTGVEELAPVPPSVTKIATEALSKLSSAASDWTKIGAKDLEAIAKLLKGRRVVVFIDDLDRADPRLIPKTLLAMRELLDWPGFSFVLAFDKRAISSALSEYSTAFGDDAQGFLEKVIDIPFEVPVAGEVLKKRLSLPVFKACCDVMPMEAVVAILPVLPSQPRRVKLIARMMGALRPSLVRHSTAEVDWVGISLYLVVKESSELLVDWVVRSATADGTDWILWAGNEQERKKKEEDTKAELLALLSTPKPPVDAERVVAAAFRLLQHWDMTSSDTILYWVGIVYHEPAVTLSEIRELRDQFDDNELPSAIDSGIRQAMDIAGVSEIESATDYLAAAISIYDQALDAMAEARTNGEWETRHAVAQKSILLLEYLWTQKNNAALIAATSMGPITVTLHGLVNRWLTWTRNDGELSLREREKRLALIASNYCDDPELIYVETDPFWNSPLTGSRESAEVIKAWRCILRDALAPRVVSRFCQKFLETDGLLSVAAGDDPLGPWLVENKESPLYTSAEMTNILIETLKSGRGASDSVRTELSKNTQLYLRQLLFQTRDASWGGMEHAIEINERLPELIPTAWSAITDVAVPFRMRSTLRKLHVDLIGINVAVENLPKPIWLVEDVDTNA